MNLTPTETGLQIGFYKQMKFDPNIWNIVMYCKECRFVLSKNVTSRLFADVQNNITVPKLVFILLVNSLQFIDIKSMVFIQQWPRNIC